MGAGDGAGMSRSHFLVESLKPYLLIVIVIVRLSSFSSGTLLHASFSARIVRFGGRLAALPDARTEYFLL